MAPHTIYTLGCNDVQGGQAGLQQFDGNVTLLVNVASHCGYTGQYTTLQALQERYADKAFSVVAFPCNDFGGQEPGDAKSINACAATHGATFPIMEKCVVKAGPGQSPIYTMLAAATDTLPRWNFGKYLVNAQGTPVAFFGSSIDPMDATVTDQIDALLGETAETETSATP